MPGKKPKGEYAIQTVTNVLRVLDAFREADDFGVTELATLLGLHKNNVFRLLATLEVAGYVDQIEATDRYRLGIRSLELGQAFLRSRSVHRLARPLLEKLAADTQECAHLAVLRDFNAVYIDSASADQLLSTGSLVGRRLPLHCSAAGKVLLGGASEAVREEFDRTVIAGQGLESRTPASIVDPHKLFEHVRTVSVAGFALEIEESAPGLCCAAAPVFNASGEVVAAISVAGPVFRLGENELLSRIAPAVTEAAGCLSRDLGYATS